MPDLPTRRHGDLRGYLRSLQSANRNAALPGLLCGGRSNVASGVSAQAARDVRK